MILFKEKFRIESARLKGWDYSTPGFYFITICTKDRQCFFGDVYTGEMFLSPMGDIVAEEWQRNAQIRTNVMLDEWVVMPNHVHGIVVIHEPKVEEAPDCIETPRRGVSTGNPAWKPGSLGSIINQYKSVCTKRIRKSGFVDFGWQSRFYDRILLDEISLEKARQYIQNNPLKWEIDKNNLSNVYI